MEGEEALEFTMEEPRKFRVLREREAKFWKEKQAKLNSEDGMPMAYARGTQVKSHTYP